MLKGSQFLGAGLLVVATTSQAGFYAGAGLGPDIVDFRQKAHVLYSNPAHPNEGFNVYEKTHLSGTGLFGTLFAGFGAVRGRYYLAGEVNGNVSSTEFKMSNVETVHHSFSASRYKINNVWGVSVLPGFQVFQDTLAYGRFGYVNGQFKVGTSDASLANVSKRLDGFRWGLGGQRAITQRVAVRMEYSQSFYASAKMSTFDTVSSVSKVTRVSPFQQLVELGLIVHFS